MIFHGSHVAWKMSDEFLVDRICGVLHAIPVRVRVRAALNSNFILGKTLCFVKEKECHENAVGASADDDAIQILGLSFREVMERRARSFRRREIHQA